MYDEKKENLKEVIEWIVCIAIAIILALLVRHYIFTPTVVKQVSMKPTMKEYDRLILDRWSITTKKELERGDIITFEAPSLDKETIIKINNNNPVAIYKNQPTGLISKFVYYVLESTKTSYIKRIIGVAGDHILIQDGKVYLNGKELEEDYLASTVRTERVGACYDFTVPEGFIFAMGDNRGESMDCRAFGCIPIEKVESKIWIRFWPFDKFGSV